MMYMLKAYHFDGSGHVVRIFGDPETLAEAVLHETAMNSWSAIEAYRFKAVQEGEAVLEAMGGKVG